jgi:hypothetical protein
MGQANTIQGIQIQCICTNKTKMKMSEGMLGHFLNSKDGLIMLQTPRYSWNIAKVGVKLWHVATCIINMVFQPYPPGYLLKQPKG